MFSIFLLLFINVFSYGCIKAYIFYQKCQKLKQTRCKELQMPSIDIIDSIRNKKYIYQWLQHKHKILITGGNGFLGRNLIEKLLSYNCEIYVLDIQQNQSIFPSNVHYIQCDLRNLEQTMKACEKIEYVFHCATPNPFTPDHQLLYDVNVKGTQNLLRACQKHHVQNFIFVSSCSVAFDGTNQQNIDETISKPKYFRDYYSYTKAMAEEIVLSYNCSTLRTISIRPHGIFGPYDPHMIPTITQNAKKGKTKFQIGDGKNLVDFTFVGNVVHALLLGAEHLDVHSGKAYFITNDEPIFFWNMISTLLIGLGYSPPYIALPYQLCLLGAWITEKFLLILNSILPVSKPLTTLFTISKVQLAGLYHYYSCDKAKNDLKYKPLWSLQEGIQLTLEASQSYKNSHSILPQTKKCEKENESIKIRKFTKEEVANHNQPNDAWIIVKDRVYDITCYVEDHPGGDSILNDVGGDATVGFYGPQHPPTVEDHIEEYFIGILKEK